jgi:hypothetical protein
MGPKELGLLCVLFSACVALHLKREHEEEQHSARRGLERLFGKRGTVLLYSLLMFES